MAEDENEPAFKPDKEEKEKIRESFFGGFSEEDSEDSSNSSEHNFSSRERRLKSNMTRQTIHQSYLESRLKADKKRFSHLPETDDIYYQLDQQYLPIKIRFYNDQNKFIHSVQIDTTHVRNMFLVPLPEGSMCLDYIINDEDWKLHHYSFKLNCDTCTFSDSD